ncbi:pyruvate-flavodoxin oxidoreductase [Enterococcus florum]|uniref:Pyruvate-flavodoxin oxidoreductase n=1 Tax=Enterococcus florum TaxID=2480627 RepID=A0A4P5PIE7_9ENTE|nr:pyruvate:ferredoxin (flavodoxin) oxidoreductase [Enterococcus florum]GCF93133.1 pyruvate-flavodoxin oxidoreductase [Enterococcus florum]
MEQVVDGNQAAAYIAYAFSEAVSLFPITPSSKMSELIEVWSKQDKQNIFGNPVEPLVMDSEANVAGSLHGLLKAGVLSSTFTSSQGLLLMIPGLYKLTGELLPGVIHVAARSVSTAALNIQGDHSDVMAVRQTGAAMLSASSVQEAALFAAVAHLAAIRGRLPVIHFFDGFDTSHELRKIQLPDYSELAACIDQQAVRLFKNQSGSNFSPKLSGTAQGPELHFQQQEAANLFQLAMSKVVEDTIQQLNPLFGTNCSSVDYYGSSAATSVIVLMGSVSALAKEAVEECLNHDEQVGLLTVHLYRPFPKQLFLEKLPKSVQQIAVLDRTKEPGSSGEPLLLDVQRVISEADRSIEVIGGRYGLGGKKTTVNQLLAIFYELKKEHKKSEFTISINDDVTKLSLAPCAVERSKKTDLTSIEFLGVGSDGTLSSAKDFVQLIGAETSLDVKADFVYPATKSRGFTTARLFFSPQKIGGIDETEPVDYLVCHELSYLNDFNPLEKIKTKGTLLLNTSYRQENLTQHLSNQVKRTVAKKELTVYLIDANRIARSYQLGPKIAPLMTASLLEKGDFQGKSSYRKRIAKHSFMQDEDYCQAVFQAMDAVLETIDTLLVNPSWRTLSDDTINSVSPKRSKFQQEIIAPIQRRGGDELSTSDLLLNGMADGSIPLGGSSYLITSPAEEVPCWQAETCRQCNICSTFCPHGAIRPFVTCSENQGTYKGKQNLDYQVLINPEKCTGCGLCVEACTAKASGTLKMKSLSQIEWDAGKRLWEKSETANQNKQLVTDKLTIRESQFVEPVLKYSGACAGCGETPYVKLLTQLFGERLNIANATGCSSIWSASAPFSAFHLTEQQTGPIWSSSLFENNSAFGLGMEQGFKLRHKQAYRLLQEVATAENYSVTIRRMAEDLVALEGKNLAAVQQFAELIKNAKDERLQRLYQLKGSLVKQTQWLIGGDGWAYDIDFGGLDHLISCGADCNILILDNEGYANTGGQLSKGTPFGAKVKFASKGNRRPKKDFGFYAMQYGEVFVAQVSLFSHPSHTQKVLQAAEAYPGTSIVIAYSPCTMNNSSLSAVQSSKEAVKSGYWPLFTYCDGQMKLYSKAPKADLFADFLQKQPRFQHSEFTQAEVDKVFVVAKQRYFNYQLLKELGNRASGKEEMT